MIYIPTSLSHPPHMLNLFFPRPYSLISPRLFSTFLPNIEQSRPLEEQSGRRPTRGSRTSLSVAFKDPPRKRGWKNLLLVYKNNACAFLTARRAILYFLLVLENFVARDETRRWWCCDSTLIDESDDHMFFDFYSRVSQALKPTFSSFDNTFFCHHSSTVRISPYRPIIIVSRNNPLWPPADFSLEK